MKRRFPLYLEQTQVDDLALLLMREQDSINRYDRARPTPDTPYRLLTELRRQCCDRSGACDPFPDMPHLPGVFEGGSKKRRRG